MQKATFERMATGSGELPLRAILAAVPHDLIVGLEVLHRAQAIAGVSSEEGVGRCVNFDIFLSMSRRDALLAMVNSMR